MSKPFLNCGTTKGCALRDIGDMIVNQRRGFAKILLPVPGNPEDES